MAKSRAPDLFRSEWFSPPPVRGGPASCDRDGAIFLCLYGALVNLGVAPQDAAESAWLFTDTGSSGRSDGQLRECGELYPDGQTFLAVHRGSGEGMKLSSGKFSACLLNVTPDDSMIGQLALTGYPVGAIILISVNDYVRRVDQALAQE